MVNVLAISMSPFTVQYYQMWRLPKRLRFSDSINDVSCSIRIRIRIEQTLSIIAQVDRDKSACSKTLRQSSRITYKTVPRFGSAISTLVLESPEARPYRDSLGKQHLESAPSSSSDFRGLTFGISHTTILLPPGY